MSHRNRRPGVDRRAPKSARVRLVVADGQAIDRLGLIVLLRSQRGFVVVGEAATVDEAIAQCQRLRPDVLVLALNLPGQEERAGIPALRESLPELRIVALSERGAPECLVLNPPYRQKTAAEQRLLCATGIDCLQLAVSQGAMATVRRSARPEDLYRAIRSAAEGAAWYDPTTATGMRTTIRPGGGRVDARLSASELKVAALIADGRSNKEISSALGISEATVKKHVGHILAKLGLEDRLKAGLLLARNPTILKNRWM